MEWWSVFRKIRKAIFIFIALTSLIWAGVLVFYLIREWIHFNILQRTIVISMISVNLVTVVVQYLMVVLPFIVWRDFMRMLFLLSIHIATTVLYTLFGPNFSCQIFSSKAFCQDVDIGFLACSWAITGLLVGYTAYLCIMSRIPRPIPKITPNLLIDSDTPRRGSVSSVTSATRLLTHAHQKEMSMSSIASTASSQSASSGTRMVPKKLFVVNGLPSPSSPPSPTPRSIAPFSRPGGSYGAMSTPRSTAKSPAPTFRTESTVSTARAPVFPSPAWDNGAAMSYGERRLSRPDAPAVQLTNPFMDPLSRPGTADTAYSGMSYGSSASSFGSRGDGQGQDRIFLSPFQLSPQAFGESEKVPHSPNSPGAESIYSLYDSPQDEHPEVDLEKATTVMRAPAHYLATVRQTSWFPTPTRTHTATPHSVHSVSPSVEWTTEQQRVQTPLSLSRARTPSQRVATPVLNRPPPPIHARAASDPVYRPYTASPRMLHLDQDQAILNTTYAPPPIPDNTVLLPNPFPMVGAANVKRYASIGHTRAQLSYPSTAANIRNAHLQAAMGRAPPRTLVQQTYYPATGMGTGMGMRRAPTVKKVVSRAEWRALVMNAAATR
ncbi:hypothetical protein EIP91_010872 [Steccherinum ochraceum]|uniref:Uncharacterized protein n=1 Tax=Steccherinum ochraceum TaxID=92696 RepID=A0A4R0R050_9APHY|nr:hypothetical protein EIP91_010872 [Steccherinum ochraceum]